MTEALEVPLKFGFDSRIKLPSWSNDSWKLVLFQVHSIPGKCKCFQCLFYVVPSSEETSFWPSSMVYIWVIITLNRVSNSNHNFQIFYFSIFEKLYYLKLDQLLLEIYSIDGWSSVLRMYYRFFKDAQHQWNWQ